MSQIFKLYYNNELRAGLTPSGSLTYYTYQERWINFAKEWDLVEEVSSNTYKWLPDYPTDPNWTQTLVALNDRMINFAEFWYNASRFQEPTGLRISRNALALADLWKKIQNINDVVLRDSLINIVLFDIFFHLLNRKY
ncbi:MAG: hypothetical protein M3Q58_11035 [Bacteroidota bacterium]|nr:hypothetical protein [Bacteroidota bacterium]